MIIEIAIYFGFALDLILTYKYLKIYKQKFPKKDYIIVEANPLVSFAIRRGGLGQGIVGAGMVIFSILIILMIVLPINLKFFMAGCYYMMITFHLTNFLALRRMNGNN